VVLANAEIIAYLGFFSLGQIIVSNVWLGSLSAFLLILLRLNASMRYTITNKKIVWSRRFFRWSKTLELPLESVKAVNSKRIGRQIRLAFEFPIGRNAIIFRRLRDDPDRIRELVLRAQSNMSTSD